MSKLKSTAKSKPKPDSIKSDPELAHVALRAAYQGQPVIDFVFHQRVAATLVTLSATLSAALRIDAEEFVDAAAEVYGQMVGEVEADIARGYDPRKGTPGIPAPGASMDPEVEPDAAIWSRLTRALGDRAWDKPTVVDAVTLFATAAKTWVLCRLDRASFMERARHFYDKATSRDTEERSGSIPKWVN